MVDLNEDPGWVRSRDKPTISQVKISYIVRNIICNNKVAFSNDTMYDDEA